MKSEALLKTCTTLISTYGKATQLREYEIRSTLRKLIWCKWGEARYEVRSTFEDLYSTHKYLRKVIQLREYETRRTLRKLIQYKGEARYEARSTFKGLYSTHKHLLEGNLAQKMRGQKHFTKADLV